MGAESEFGILDGWSSERADAVQRALLSEPHMPSAKARGGVFLANGSRAYIDQGQNEYATPETESPFDLVAREMAGRALMQQAADTFGLSLLCSNFDYSSGNTWGCHENYECSGKFPITAFPSLFTHLVTRTILTGAGGIDPDHPGVRLILSPRATVLELSLNVHGAMRKSLVFRKPENHCSGLRLHVFCGEGLLSHTASFVRYGATALVALLLDRGERIGPGAFRQSPIRVLRQLNRDTSLCRLYELESGEKFSAVEIQWKLLEDVASRVDSLPDWARSVILRWERLLNDLETCNPRAGEIIDWLIYRDALLQLAEEHGIEPGQLSLADPHCEKIMQLRAASCELYVRLHALGRDSLFQKLEFNGTVRHRLPEVSEERIAWAMSEPPAGRAANRATFIRSYAKARRFSVTWDFVADLNISTMIPIPCEPVADWEAIISKIPVPEKQEQVPTLGGLFRQGRYAEALKLHAASGQTNSCDIETLSLSYARLGRRIEAMQTLDSLRTDYDEFYHLAETMACVINFGLTPPVSELQTLVQRGDAMVPGLLQQEGSGSYSRFVFLQHKAAFLMHSEQYAEADGIFENLLRDSENLCRPRMCARTRCFYAELLRRMGRSLDALTMADTAFHEHSFHDLHGDRADYSLPILAKLTRDDNARGFLKNAESFQRKHGNQIGLARVLCLRARRLRTDENRLEIFDLIQALPVLKECRTASRIAENWEQWINPDQTVLPADYWGL